MSNAKTAAAVASDITVFMKYSKYMPELKRRETWEELVWRNAYMHIDKFPQLKDTILSVYKDFVLTKKVLPSMRSLQFAGAAIDANPSRMYNCAYMPIDSYHSFNEAMFLLLGGTGVGYSVQRQDVVKLPTISKSSHHKRYLIADSIEGWADAVKVLMKWAFGLQSWKPVFDYSAIREKGARLITSGGKAPGAEPLRICLQKIEKMLSKKKNGSRLSTLEVHDILCHEANAVLAGGIRRAALICLFSADDREMLTCKSGNWWEENEQRGRANNSVMLDRGISYREFSDIWELVKASGAGEPGFYFTNDKSWGTNPCCEIALRPFQFCNLVEINGSDLESQADLNERAAAAAFIATLQATYTDFHYLRPIWKETTEKDALIGVGMTGIGSGVVLEYDLKEAAEFVRFTNENTAANVGINAAARNTCVKPSGTSSLVLGTASGIHAWFAEFFLRRIRVGKNEAIYTYLLKTFPALIEDDQFKPGQAIITLPMCAPEGSLMRSESPIQTLERVKKFAQEWILPGHVDGPNTHNVSCTINLKEDEWESVGEWMYENRDHYNGISVMPFDGGTYIQAPFEECTKETYDDLMTFLDSIDLSEVLEEEDNTDLTGEVACVNGKCEIF